jgi:hypothetical protein
VGIYGYANIMIVSEVSMEGYVLLGGRSKTSEGAFHGNLPHFENIDNQRNMWEV